MLFHATAAFTGILLYASGQASAAPNAAPAASCRPPSNENIPGMHTNNVAAFNCPPCTLSHLTHAALQAAMNDFAYIFYTEKDVSKAFNKYVATNYLQHNPDVADGRDAAITALTPLFGSSTNGFVVGSPENLMCEYNYFTDAFLYQLVRVMVGPEYTTIHLKATNEGGPFFNVFDVYKMQDSCIVEHWDCLEQIGK